MRLLVLCLLIGLGASGQTPYTKINESRHLYRMWADSTFRIPTGTTVSLNGGLSGAGALFYKTTDSTVYTWTGTQWIALRGAANFTGSQGDLLYFSGTNTIANLSKSTSATRYLSNTGSSNNPAWAQINLANGVTGTLPFGNGGTGLSALGSANQLLRVNAGATALEYFTPSYVATRDRFGFSGEDVSSSAGRFHDLNDNDFLLTDGGQIYLEHSDAVNLNWLDLNNTYTEIYLTRPGGKEARLFLNNNGTSAETFIKATFNSASSSVAANGELGVSIQPNEGRFSIVDLPRITDTTGYDVLTINRADDTVRVAASSLYGGGGSGANTALSNLASVAVNTTIASDADNTDDLGTSSFSWKDIYTRTVKFDGSSSGTATVQAPATAGTTTITLPGATGTLATLAGTETLTNKRWTARVGSTTSSGTPSINTDNVDIYKLTAQAANITSMTSSLTGTPVDGDIIEIQITGTGSFSLTWGASFVSTTVSLPTSIDTNTLTVVLQYYTTSSYGNNKWGCVNYY